MIAWFCVAYSQIWGLSVRFSSREKTGNFGHQVNSDIHLQTVEIQMRRLPSHQDFHCLLS